ISQSDPPTIHSLLEESLTLFRELGQKVGVVSSFNLLGRLALSQGDVDTARLLVEESVVISREIGIRWSTAQSLSVLASLKAHLGEFSAARVLYEESLAIARKVGNKWLIASCLEGLAGVVATQEELAKAARLWGAAKALREAMGTPLPPVYRAEYERAVADARVQLGEKAFAAAWAEGRSMTPEQALAAQGPETIPESISIEPSSTPSAKPA